MCAMGLHYLLTIISKGILRLMDSQERNFQKLLKSLLHSQKSLANV
jgi:hypothetical protein